MSSIKANALRFLISFFSGNVIDKVLVEKVKTDDQVTHTVAAATLMEGSTDQYMPQTDILTIPNHAGKKCFFSMSWSINGTDWYNQKHFLYNQGNSTTRPRATVGMALDANNIYFYFTHYYGSPVNFRIKYVLDNIL